MSKLVARLDCLNSTFRVSGRVAEGIREPLRQGGRDFDGLRAQVGHG